MLSETLSQHLGEKKQASIGGDVTCCEDLNSFPSMSKTTEN